MRNRILAALAATGLILTGLANPASAETSLTGAGSSYANKFITTCDTTSDTFTVNYQSVGSGAGRTAFAASTVDFGASDSAVTPLTLSGARANGRFTYIPVVGGPIAIAFNLSGTGIKAGELKLTPAVIASIFAGKIKTWNHKAIKSLQDPAVAALLPSNFIQVVYRGTSSGTSDNFTNYMSQTAPTVWTWAHSSSIYGGSSATAPAGAISASNASDLVAKVKTTKYTIGYADLADTLNANGSVSVPVASVLNAAGEYQRPSSKASSTFLAEFYDDNFNAKTGAVTLDYKKKVKGGYNLSLITYLMADKLVDPATVLASGSTAADVEAWATYLLKTCGPTQAAKIGYAPIAGNLKTAALSLASNITG